MRYAFISDIHGKTNVLRSFVAALRKEPVDMIVCLGDTGTDSAYDMLRSLAARGTFGNYEVSGYRHLSPENQSYVLGLPPVFSDDDFLAAHAVPYHPVNLSNVVHFNEYMAKTGTSWRAVFPYPGQNEETLWKVYAELLARDRHIFFHGHTHQQKIWAVHPDQRLRNIKVDSLAVESGTYYIIAVGSLGRPDDGPQPRYVIYDSAARTVELRALGDNQT